MKDLIRKNIIASAAVMITTLMIVIIGFTFYNRQVAEKNNELRQQSEVVVKQVETILTHVMHGLDMGLRAYALTGKEEILMPFDGAIKDSGPLFRKLDSNLVAQSYGDVPALRHFKLTIGAYIDFNKQMAEAVRTGRMEDFKKMQAEDRGYGVWVEYSKLSDNIIKFENKLNQESLHRYQAAMDSNTFLLFILLGITVPTLAFIVFKIRKDEKARKNLLLGLEENNRKYIFNPGTELKNDNPEEVIERSIRNFKEASEFIKHISNGNFEIDWTELNEKNKRLNDGNLVGELVKMRERMKVVKAEDEKRLWVTEGLASFSEMVRNHQSRLETLAAESVRFLAKYLNAQQGSLFILKTENEKPFLEMAACYAFNKKKYIEKRVDIGSGLVGQAYLEKETILLKEIPNGYTAITSGLGDATPSCLVLIPLKYNGSVEGILELASFQPFAPHQVSFLEKAGEFVASALMTVKISERTTLLLSQSQQQAEMMKAQEEELRQNLEELEATKEEILRKTSELVQKSKILEHQH